MSLIKRKVHIGIQDTDDLLEDLDGSVLNNSGLRGALRGLEHSVSRASSKKSKQTWEKKRGVAKSGTLVKKADNVL